MSEMMPIYVKKEDRGEINAIRKACKDNGIIFSKMAVEAIKEHFINGKWGNLMPKPEGAE